MAADATWSFEMIDILKGELVRLSAVDPEEFSKAFTGWRRDSEFMRLIDSSEVMLRSQKDSQKWIEKELEDQEVNQYMFTIRTLADDKLLGDIGLSVVNWMSRDAFVGLGIGERDFWGRGYGTDVMKVILRYAFTEINLRRVTLSVFEYNPRAVRSYEKAGFVHEGRMRQFLNREGKRWDMLFMGILREEWMNLQKKEKENI
jgi:RimJ/RimL family protein N-acetyltransferase